MICVSAEIWHIFKWGMLEFCTSIIKGSTDMLMYGTCVTEQCRHLA